MLVVNIMVQDNQFYMNLALEEAKKAYLLDEVPIGCVIVRDGVIVSQAYNRKTLDNVATYHAEVVAIEEACQKLKTWYLDECTLYTTVEPCLMCTGAIIQARIPRVVYGTRNEAFGYLSKLEDTKVKIISGILKDECSQILTDFFKKQREKPANSLLVEC